VARGGASVKESSIEAERLAQVELSVGASLPFSSQALFMKSLRLAMVETSSWS
jgi:hypothetical protein